MDLLILLMPAVAEQWPLFWPLVLAVFGGVFGSFFNCALHRLPRGESLWHPPSKCPKCNFRLGIPDLIPIFSYIFLCGKCRNCGSSIGLRYALVECLCAGLGVASWVIVGNHPSVFLVFIVFLILTFFTSYRLVSSKLL